MEDLFLMTINCWADKDSTVQIQRTGGCRVAHYGLDSRMVKAYQWNSFNSSGKSNRGGTDKPYIWYLTWKMILRDASSTDTTLQDGLDTDYI